MVDVLVDVDVVVVVIGCVHVQSVNVWLPVQGSLEHCVTVTDLPGGSSPVKIGSLSAQTY